MKKIVSLILLATIMNFAQQKSTITKKYTYEERHIVAALQSENNGVVENMIFQIALNRILEIDIVSPKVLAELEKLKIKGRTKKIRGRSLLVTNFVKNFGHDITHELKTLYLNQETLFDLIEFFMIHSEETKHIEKLVKE